MKICPNFDRNLWISSKIHRFYAKIHGLWGFSSVYIPKFIQKSADFNKICRFPKLSVSLMSSWRLREKWGFFPILMEIHGFQAKSMDFNRNLWISCRNPLISRTFAVSTTKSVQKSADFTWNLQISWILHTWPFSLASSKVFLMKDQRKPTHVCDSTVNLCNVFNFASSVGTFSIGSQQ